MAVHQANTILQTTKEKKMKHNDSEENENYLRKGKIGLKMIMSNDFGGDSKKEL